jgi:hypothetical protein
MKLTNGHIHLAGQPYPVRLSLCYWRHDMWHDLPLQQSADGYSADSGEVQAQLELHAEDELYSYSLSFQAAFTTRVLLRLDVPNAVEPFHVVPGCIFGDNNMASSLGHAPNLTAQHRGEPSCSPVWELRADCAPLPISALYADGFIVAASIEAYSDGEPLETDWPEEFIRNGLYAQVAHDGAADACGVVIGHARRPHFFMEKLLPVDVHHATGAAARGRIYLRPAEARTAVHDIVREEYYFHRVRPEPPISRHDAIAALVDAFLRVNWHDATGHNALGDKPPRMSEFFGGTEIRESFTNMRCNDAERKHLLAWRSLIEIGWSGGTVIADPLLQAGYELGNEQAIAIAVEILDRIAAGINPASGLLWDVNGKYEGTRVNWWWSGYMVQDCHCAYTNGSAVWHLLKAYRYAKEQHSHEYANWLQAACAVLDTIIELQLPDGNFGYTYALDRKAILDADGYAGAWFVGASALAYEETGKDEYLKAARRGAAYYHACTARLMSYGTPMDQYKWPDQEGNLALLRAAPILHRITGDAVYLQMLRDAAGYEYLWRYGQRTRPQAYPLKDSHWNSCGGCMTGVFSWQHPMGMFVNPDLLYLAEQTGDDYHRHRAEDGHYWGINTVSIYPEVSEYGIRGVMTECYCQSAPRPNEFNADGSPASLWHSYNGWAAAATLEGLLEGVNSS